MNSLHHSTAVRVLASLLLAAWAVGASSAAVADTADPAASEVKLFPHVFSYQPTDGGRHRVTLGGDFNGWSHDATPMIRQSDGAYSVSVQMTEGVHLYKFLVDGKWVNDPGSDADLEQPDGFGGKNSAVFIGLDARRFPPPPPNQIVAALLGHDPTDIRYRNVVSPGQLRLGFRAQAGNIQAATILWTSDNISWNCSSSPFTPLTRGEWASE